MHVGVVYKYNAAPALFFPFLLRVAFIFRIGAFDGLPRLLSPSDKVFLRHNFKALLYSYVRIYVHACIHTYYKRH